MNPSPGQKNRWIAFAIFLASLFLTFEITYRSGLSIKEQQEHEIIDNLTYEVNSIGERLRSHKHFLRAEGALFAASDSVTINEWEEFVRKSNSREKLPGILSAGVTFMENSSEINFSKPVEYFHFFDTSQKAAPLKEMFSGPEFHQAMEEARDKNTATLVFRKNQGEEISAEGFMFVPVYKKDKPYESIRERQLAGSGWIYTSFSLYEIIGDLYSDYPDIGLKIFSLGKSNSDSLLYEHNYGIKRESSDHTHRYVILPFEFNDDKLSFHFSNLKSSNLLFTGKIIITLVSGILISLILFFLAFHLLMSFTRTRLKAEQLSDQLTQSETLRSAIFDSASVGIMFIDRNFRIVMANSWWTEKTGYTNEEFRSFTTEEITHPDYRQINSEIISKLLNRENISIRIKKRYLRKDGSDFWGDLSISSVDFSDVNDILMIGVVTDITSSIDAENIIHQKNEELEKLIKERNRFISTLAHDLKSPFNSMLGFSDLMVEDFRTYDIVKIESNLRIINYTIHQTYNLFNDIIAWAKMQSGRLSYNPKNLSINDICSETVKGLKMNAENKKISIHHIFPEEFHIYADNDMVKSIMRNLLFNSIKFTGANGHIRITGFNKGCIKESTPASVCQLINDNPYFMVIAVSDDGIGIDSEKLSKLFDLPSDHLSRGTENEEGTGMGLLLCSEFLARHGGKIWAESSSGQGATFYFSLPVGLT